MADFQEKWREFEDEVGELLVDAIRTEAPRDTGQLADETQSWRDEAGVLQVISTDDRGPIAKYNILGTAPHPIDPVNGEYLVFVGADGNLVFARHVDHPGTAPNPYNQRAWENVRDEVIERFKRTVGVGYAVAYLNPHGGTRQL